MNIRAIMNSKFTKMKKTFSLLFSVATIWMLSGCAKERDNYDTFLTSETWTMTSINEDSKYVKQYDNVPDLAVDSTVTRTYSSSINNGKITNIDYNERILTPGTTTFKRTTSTGSFSYTFKFNKDGTYQTNLVVQPLSSQTDDETGNGPLMVSTASPTTRSGTGLWSWQNTADTKQIILLDGQASYKVSISKNSMEWSQSSNGTESNRTASLIYNYNYSRSTVYKFSK